MKDETLERVWRSRKAIASRCGNDSRRLVSFLQERERKCRSEQADASRRGRASLGPDE